LIESNEITQIAAENREKYGTKILKRYMDILGEVALNLPAIFSLLIGGIYYLGLRSKTAQIFNTIQLDTEPGWVRIEKALDQLVDLLFNKIGDLD
jgi:glucokinase